jgi:hypothetical protein
MLKISAVYLIGKAEIPIHYTTWALVEQALLKSLKCLVREYLAKKLFNLPAPKGIKRSFPKFNFVCNIQTDFV